MKKMRRYLLAAALAVAAALALLPGAAFAAEGDTFTAGGLKYRVLADGQTVEVINPAQDPTSWIVPDSTYSGSVTVPTQVQDGSDTTYRVVGIDGLAFYNAQLSSVTLSEGLEYIDGGAFASSTLTSLAVPASVMYLGGDPAGDSTSSPVFYSPGNGACQLETLTFATGSKLTTIADSVFEGCDNLETVEIPAGVTDLGPVADYFSSVSVAAFSGWKNDKNVTFAEGSVYSNDGGVLYKGDALLCALDGDVETVVVKEGTKTIGDSAFMYCTELKSVTLPEGLETIGDDAFDIAPNIDLEAPSIPGVTVVGSQPASLDFINIPASVTLVGENFLKGALKDDGTTLVIMQGEVPPSFGEGLFTMKADAKPGARIVYPANAAEAYRETGYALAAYIPGDGDEDAGLLDYRLDLPATLTVCPGGMLDLGSFAEVPDSARLTFESSDESVATADAAGTVTAVSAGTATISAAISISGITVAQDSCEITVGHVASATWEHDAASHWHVCAACDETLDATAHTFGDWKIVAEPTSTEEGSRERACSVCGYTETGVIPAQGGTTETEKNPSQDDDTDKKPEESDPNKKTSEERESVSGLPRTGDVAAFGIAALALLGVVSVGAGALARFKRFGK